MKRSFCAASMAVLIMIAGSAESAVEVPSDASHVVGGTNSVVGTLIAIDVPVLDTSIVYNNTDNIGGPSWTTGGGIIAHAADQGFQLMSRAGDDYTSRSGFVWEPDGTPIAEARSYGAYNGPNPEVQYRFNLGDSGIDIPDGSVINGIYTTWKRRNDTADYRFTEGSQSDTDSFNFGGEAEDDLILRWYPSDADPVDANFQQLFDSAEDPFTPITVEGGDGFLLEQFRQPNTAHIDAVILDITLNDGGGGDDLPGDFNGDEIVDLADYTFWRNNLGADESVLAPGSGNNSGTVDSGDYDTWKGNFGAMSGSGSLGVTAVPEPNTFVMLVGAIGLGLVGYAGDKLFGRFI